MSQAIFPEDPPVLPGDFEVVVKMRSEHTNGVMAVLAHPGSIPPHQQMPAMFDVGEADADRAGAAAAAQLLGDGPLLN